MPLRIRLETARLKLVPLAVRWREDLFRLFNDPVVADWLFLTGPPTREQLDKRIEASEVFWRANGYGMFAVLDKNDDRFVARVGAMVTPETGRTEIAWSTMPDVHSKGLATEAAEAAIEFTFARSNLQKLDCYLRPDNAASRRVAEKVGFRYQDTRYLYDRILRFYELQRAAKI
ncbi:MAG: GNAT family N-acetyltransferase [Alphaproteobacteria bacterium]|nr:GNAT family N-acetyltransferase [Alphaproteobacteria bacterium]